MKNYLKYFLFTVVFVVQTVAFAGCGCEIHKTKDAIREYLSSHYFNATYMITQDGEVLSKGAAGYFSVEDKRKLHPNQQMAVASGTKPITAAAILRLQDKGLLDVNDTVAKLLPADCGLWPDKKLPDWASKVTLHHLMTHTSGVAEYIPSLQVDFTKKHKEINKQILAYAANTPLVFEPGSKHEYANTGFIILGLVVEQVSKERLSKFFYKEFFKPLGMKKTFLCSLEQGLKYQRGELSHKYPTRYFVTPTGAAEPQVTPAKIPFVIAPFSDGGIVSTARDMVRFHTALHNGEILSEKSYKQMTTEYGKSKTYPGLENNNYGYGIFISTLSDGSKLYRHSGNAIAIRSEFGYIPSRKFCYAVLSNTMMHIPEEMRSKVDMKLPQNQVDIGYFQMTLLHSVIGASVASLSK